MISVSEIIDRPPWGLSINGSLRSLITTGTGLPNSSPGERNHPERLAG